MILLLNAAKGVHVNLGMAHLLLLTFSLGGRQIRSRWKKLGIQSAPRMTVLFWKHAKIQTLISLHGVLMGAIVREAQQ